MTFSFASWSLLLLSICLEYILFRGFVSHTIATTYPPGFDQAYYLSISYWLHENIIHSGLVAALKKYQLISVSFLFPLQAAFFYFLFGASRLIALSTHFFYFALLQIIAFATLKKLTQRYLWGFIFIGMLLSTESFFLFGGAVDFRIDFSALCLYGIVICLILRSQVFLQKKWVIAGAIAAAFLIAMRFLTVAYIFGVVLSLLFYWILMSLCSKPDALLRHRIKNVFLFSIIISIITLPILWIHKDLLYGYYIYGHVLGPEKYWRLKMVGITNIYNYFMFYPMAFIVLHLTSKTFLILAMVLFLLFGFYLEIKLTKKPVIYKLHDSNEIIFLLITILVPLIVLTLDISKSPIVINIILIPFLLLVVMIYSRMYHTIFHYFTDRRSLLLKALAILFIFEGAFHFAKETSESEFAQTYYDPSSQLAITQMVNDIGNYVTQAKWKSIYATTDKHTDFFISIPIFYYEMHGILFPMNIGYGAASLDFVKNREEGVNKVMQSDLFLADTEQVIPNKFILFDQSIHTFRPFLLAAARSHLILLKNYNLKHIKYEVYIKNQPLRASR